MQTTISKTYKQELLNDLKDKEYREAFVASHINNGISFQIKTMRENRNNMTQAELANLTGMKQTAISRLENPTYGHFTLNTLKNIASAFDVALMVKFVPFSELVKWDLNLSSESLNASSFKQDSFFEKEKTSSTVADVKHYQVIPPEISNKVVTLNDHRLKTLSSAYENKMLASAIG
jgi:transcriptional regulator with XRE-family HTH domain